MQAVPHRAEAPRNRSSSAKPAKSPILIVGSVRSGTTLFRLMLGCHSKIGYAAESEFGFHGIGDNGFPEVRTLHERLATHRQFLSRGFEIDHSLSYPDLLRDFLRQADEQSGKAEVAAVIHSGFHRAPEIWPNARYIHMLRDPRDVARSCVGMGWAGNAYYGVDHWITAEQRWDAICAKVPEQRRFEVRFEDMVSEPEATLRGVCDFLSLRYEPGMLDYEKDSSYDAPNARLSFQWRALMSEDEAALVEGKCGSLLERRGYAPQAAVPKHPGMLGEAALWLDHRQKRAQGSIRKYGATLWTLERMSRVLPSGVRSYVTEHKLEVDRSRLK